jgi:SNF2 family DNA or RNA helicase
MKIPVTYNWQVLDDLQTRIRQNGPWSSHAFYRLAHDVAKAEQIDSFSDLQTLRYGLPISPLPHQISTAKHVLTHMHGRAILADEVGLGKTIEAGLLLKEYLIRGLVRKALILVPASLVLQWVRELHEKFNIHAVAHKKHYVFETEPIVIASLESAKKQPQAELILNQHYDMLIVDEAHKLKNPRTRNYQFIQSIRKTFCLFLTATPLQNNREELFHLMHLVRPGLCKREDVHRQEAFQAKIQSVVIRNRRAEHIQSDIQRIIHNIPLKLSAEELDLYHGVEAYIRNQVHTSNASQALALITLQREVCSSRDAVFVTLVNLFKKLPESDPRRAQIWALVDKIKQIKANTKAEAALNIIRSIPDKVVIFTEYRATQQYLMHMLQQHNIPAIPYQGGMGRGKKDWMAELFQSKMKVLVATEAGGEGINLQFCNQLINFDLPWNPMRIEQRIGRVHRLGQSRDVHIYNLVTEHTIESHVLGLLEDKIDIFRHCIGELDPILANAEKSIQTHVLRHIQINE